MRGMIRTSALDAVLVALMAIGSNTAALHARPLQDAQPPAAQELSIDDIIDQKTAKFYEWYRDNQGSDLDTMSKFVEELLADLDVNALSATQIISLSQGMYIPPSLETKLEDRLETLAKAPTADGAEAAIASIPFAMRTGRAADAVKTAINHPGLAEAMTAGRGTELFNMLGVIPPEELRGMKDQVLGLSEVFNDSMPPRAVASLSAYLEAINAMGDDAVDLATKEKIRTRILDLTRSAAAKAKTEGDAPTAEYLEGTARFLDGAYARGKLIDHPAPTIAFTWSSSEPPLNSLDDLKGKVIVLDFWATWCGPCVGSFPSVRELQKHYEGYPVAIVGVTSAQGMHITPDRQQISTEGDEPKEHELMKEYIGQQDITWTIAFSKDSVFNPEFGVRGIPHVAIVDAEGIVRYNGLHPSTPLSEKAEKIDALLKKAGLPAPAPVPAAPELSPDAANESPENMDE